MHDNNGNNDIHLVIPEGVVSIQEYAFFDCSNLVDVQLPSTIERLEGDAFSYSALKNINFPSNLKYIGGRCFAYTNLTTIELPNEVIEYGEYVFEDCRALYSVKLPSQMTTIPRGMFSECSSLSAIELPETITSIEGRVFGLCTTLKDINLPIGLRTIDYGAFYNCIALKTIILPSTLTEIGTYCFEGCTALESIDLPDQISIIPVSLFAGCTGLKSVTLPQNLKVLQDECFKNTGISEIILPEGVVTIETYCFQGCTNLKFVSIPSTVTTIGGNNLDGCNNLTTIIWDADVTVPLLGTQNNPNCLLYVANETTQVNETGIQNIIRNGVAENITLASNIGQKGLDYSFNAPREFKAKKITYARYFSKTTQFGSTDCWQTIALPFTPTSITTEDGRVLAPFNSGVADAKPFWLRRLTSEGFAAQTQLEAGVPYIIAMPNNSAYLPEYNIKGIVTFSAEDEAGITIPATQTQLATDNGPRFSLSTNFEHREWDTYNPIMGGINEALVPEFYVLQDGYFNRTDKGILSSFHCYATTGTPSSTRSFSLFDEASTRSAGKPLGSVPSIDDL